MASVDATDLKVSTRSRPKAADATVCMPMSPLAVSTRSRPKAADFVPYLKIWRRSRFQHAAARRRLTAASEGVVTFTAFQHAAARRRLRFPLRLFHWQGRFQHAAARRRLTARHGCS